MNLKKKIKVELDQTDAAIAAVLPAERGHGEATRKPRKTQRDRQ